MWNYSAANSAQNTSMEWGIRTEEPNLVGQANLPLSFWGYALETAAFTLNRVPNKSVEKTPYEIWTGKRPGLSFLKVWGVRLMSNV